MVLPKTKIPFFMHDLGQEELDSVAEVLRGPILTTGKTVAQFETLFAGYLGRPHALGVTSCTGALHMAFLAHGIGAGDEVITTPQTFIATATAILEAGAKPVFVDVEPDTGNLDASKIEKAVTARTKAIVPVHLYGLLCDMKAIRKVADKHKLIVIEDAAHCIEGERDGVRPGQLSEAACFSFYATKNITCGEGGAIAVNDASLYEKLRLLRLHGMNKNAADRHAEGYKHWDMPVLGWKYNMDNIQAALLLPQMKRIGSNLKKREALAQAYFHAFKEVPEVKMPAYPAGARHAYHLFTVWIEPAKRDRVIDFLQNEGISVMVNYRPVHLMTYFAEAYGCKKGDFPNAERIGDSTISLPLYPNMPLPYVREVVEAVKRAL